MAHSFNRDNMMMAMMCMRGMCMMMRARMSCPTDFTAV